LGKPVEKEKAHKKKDESKVGEQGKPGEQPRATPAAAVRHFTLQFEQVAPASANEHMLASALGNMRKYCETLDGAAAAAAPAATPPPAGDGATAAPAAPAQVAPVAPMSGTAVVLDELNENGEAKDVEQKPSVGGHGQARPRHSRSALFFRPDPATGIQIRSVVADLDSIPAAALPVRPVLPAGSCHGNPDPFGSCGSGFNPGRGTPGQSCSSGRVLPRESRSVQ